MTSRRSSTAFVPRFAFGEHASLDRVGGLPHGLAPDAWPSCGMCRAPMSFVAQLSHDAERFDLGELGRVAYVFLCLRLDTQCTRSTGVPHNEDGAHAIVIAKGQGGVTDPPSNLPPHAPGLAVESFERRDESCDPRLFDALVYGLHRTRPDWPAVDEDDEDVTAEKRRDQGRTKIGGIPRWIQDPWFQREEPKRFRYVAQIASIAALGDTWVATTLRSGTLYLLRDTETGSLTPCWFAR